jgi:hypothetical protein
VETASRSRTKSTSSSGYLYSYLRHSDLCQNYHIESQIAAMGKPWENGQGDGPVDVRMLGQQGIGFVFAPSWSDDS